MFCHNCGTRIQEGASFCPSCGKALGGGVPLMPRQGRIAGHVRLLGILWMAMSAFSILPGLFMLAFFGHGAPYWWGGPPAFVGGFMRMFGMLFLAGGALGIITGWGLLDRQPWARMLAIVLGFFSLFHIPFGTALGIYTLWVLLPAESEHEYRSMARAA